MEKNCPFCGAEMPEEANFCLTCFSMCSASNEAGAAFDRGRRKAAFRPHGKRRAERLVSATLTLFLILGTILTVLPSAKEIPTARQTPNSSEQTQNEETGEEKPPDATAALSTGTQTSEEPVRLSGVAESVFGKVTGLGLPAGTTSSVGLGTLGTQSGSSSLLGGQKDAEKPTTGNSDSNTENNTPGGGETATQPEETTPTEPEYDNFEYKSYSSKNDKVTLIKYKGNSSKVLVPAVIDGKPVAAVAEDTFANNSNIKEIIFESDEAQTFLWLNAGCMKNLSELKVVRMPITDLGIYPQFAINCRKLEDIQIDNSQYKFQDGALYYWSSRQWELRFYAPACKNETLTVASWCAGFDGACNLDENPYLKRIELHKNVKLFPSNYKINDALESVYVEPGNPKGFSVDGVLFYQDSKGQYVGSLYPPSKKDKTFVMPENVTMNMYRYYCPYLEEIWIPASSGVNSPDTLYFRQCFTNLKVIHLQKGHAYEEKCKSTFTGKTEMY